ncbi:tripartite tricarboxylate transporter substrate binding protein [Comamonas sp. GB3 AK4-5]|uniref:tripartite tricarboxylate transporter substrate binding protein n=1 Tax=Comamonas sp. GB3 AK4-5 TaxID=3231487 RepID=UPI00351E623E
MSKSAPRRKGWVLWTGAALLLAAGLWQAGTGMASLRKDRPLTIVVTFPPGGGTDLLARKLGAALQARTGQTVVVENRPGASGNIGAREVAQAPADGHTLLMVNSAFAINPGVYRQLDFDPRKDFKAVFNVGTIASVLVVPQTSALWQLSDALAMARASRPLAFASCGNGTPQHLAGEMLAQGTDTAWQHVPYKGCGPAVLAVAAGQVPMAVVTASSAAPLMAAGRVRAIATTAPARLAQWPELPTVAEQGLPGFALEQWHGLLAPAGMPDATIQHWHAALRQQLDDPDMQLALQAQGYTLVMQSAAEFAALIQADMERYAATTQSLDLQMD